MRGQLGIGAMLVLAAGLVGCGGALVEPSQAGDGGGGPSGAADANVRTPDALDPVDAALANDVGSPVAEDRAPVSTDAGNPTADCNTPRVLLGNVPVFAARMARLGDGLLVVWAAGSRTGIQAQRYDRQLRPQGFATQLGWLTGEQGVSVAMDVRDNRAVVAVQSRLYSVRYTPEGAPIVDPIVALGDGNARAVRLMAQGTVQVVMDDGRFVFASEGRTSANTPDRPLSAPFGSDVTVGFPADGGGYSVYAPQPGVEPGRLTLRRFIFGHGAVLEVGGATADGVDAAPVALSGDTAYRLVQTGGREVSLQMETLTVDDLRPRARPRVMDNNAAWHRSSGAIAVDGASPLLVWSARAPSAGYNNLVRAQWPGLTETTTLYAASSETTVQVWHALAAEGAGWALFAEMRGSSGVGVQARCVPVR